MTYLILTLITVSALNIQNTFNFANFNTNQMMIVNDTVMGGRSFSQYGKNEQAVTFNGDISLRNNGGFASLRMAWPFKDANASNRIQLKLTGDGKIYEFRLRTNRGYAGASYVFEFQTIKDKSITIDMNLEQFVPSFRGRVLRDMPILRLKDVKQMGLLIAAKQVGEFSIQLENISVLPKP
jgi:NADH dehydrogenase [ubiquinone] 1 alpha subcomplex assembly factor 1